MIFGDGVVALALLVLWIFCILDVISTDTIVTATGTVALTSAELSMLLEGIDVRRARTSGRWDPPMHASRAA